MVPLPALNFADSNLVWAAMVEKEKKYCRRRNPKFIENHPNLCPEFRLILVDWLSEVSKACMFHRETYHLAVDFLDRYLSVEKDVKKCSLQLVGVTCLFISSKFEEIRPPTVLEFSELTDGAYTVSEILKQEIIVLSSIGWNITPLTANSWLQTFFQCLQPSETFIIPNKTHQDQKRIECLVDLALLDIESVQFSYSILAASAMYFFIDMNTLQKCTGFKFKDIHDCVVWLKPFAELARLVQIPQGLSSSSPPSQTQSQNSEDYFQHCNVLRASEAPVSHQLHHHLATKALLERVHERRATRALQNATSAVTNTSTHSASANVKNSSPEIPTSLLTPPRSTKKRRSCL